MKHLIHTLPRLRAQTGRFFQSLTATRRRRLLLAATASAGALLLALRLIPAAPLQSFATQSSAIYAADGSLLRLTLAQDEQYRLWLPLKNIHPALIEAVLLYEDRWFYQHPGVNPAALVRSTLASLGGTRRQGGSTLSMQLARRLYAIDSRSLPGKLHQIAAALWLEARYSKAAILEAYLNFAPYGANIEGVGAASLIFFHKTAARLSLSEALSLAVIPQNPRQRGGGREAGLQPARQAAHARLSALWLAQHPDDARFTPQHAPPLLGLRQLPFAAPHLVNQLLADGLRGEIHSSLIPAKQATLDRIISQYIAEQGAFGLHNAVAMLVDTRSLSVEALVGSADFHNDAILGQVDGTLARRSPGSTLKPFVYALAIDQGVLHPRSMLKDAPTAFGPFSPENFDGEFIGPISAEEALVRSRNIPAVAVAARLQRPDLYDLLQQSGLGPLKPREHYGLALTLGGGEVSMEELLRLYGLLARGGRLAPLQRLQGDKAAPASGPQLISEEAAFVVLDMLRTNPRPDTARPASPPVAWKTGTSWGFRDAWSVGVFDGQILAVWLGNFEGQGDPALIGVRAAAPLFFRIIDALRAQQLSTPAAPTLPPRGLRKVEVCAATGDLPNAACPNKTNTWFIPGKSPIRESTLHRKVLIDRRNGQIVCTPSPWTDEGVREFWSPDMLELFRQTGLPRRALPTDPCSKTDSPADSAPEILSPRRGETYSLRLSTPTPLPLRAHGSGELFWFANDSFLGRSSADATLSWSPPTPGRYLLRVADSAGRVQTREVDIEFVP